MPLNNNTKITLDFPPDVARLKFLAIQIGDDLPPPSTTREGRLRVTYTRAGLETAMLLMKAYTEWVEESKPKVPDRL